MNSLNYLSRHFDAALTSAKTPPSTPTTEYPPSQFLQNKSSSSGTSSALPRVQTWSTKSFLFASRPSSSLTARPKRSLSSPADFITLASLQAQSPATTTTSLSLETPPVGTSIEPIHRTFLMRILVLAWNTLRAAWASLAARTGLVQSRSAVIQVAEKEEEEGQSTVEADTNAGLYMAPKHAPAAATNALPTPPPMVTTDPSASRSSTPTTTRKTPFHLPKTLVLDLDETLIHSTSRPLPSTRSGFFGLGGNKSSGRMVEVVLGGHTTLYHVYKRPFADFFLRTVSGWYTLVIFTASMQEYADPIIDWLDAGRGILAHRLFRDSCTQLPNGSYTKDLSVVDSDLSRVCLIDNSPISYRVNEANGIPIEGWTHDPSDEALLDLLPFLDSLRFTSDVRRVLGLRTAGGFS
ncbi:FCP1-like proteiny domain-containing protein [Mycena indigotica]|uniref:FCP1-like proteiny domain-containing protein n=1 Tax=Mycena indigotica TaxID=2126181 RepID=A0A8H6SN13_9AGAR|nr:FCP1-like proteiny domain-containing protein [Mycena indigotica]KAF7301646.1 FCP1-like proteiny domain-containing protein [Mycena indigotica]